MCFVSLFNCSPVLLQLIVRRSESRGEETRKFQSLVHFLSQSVGVYAFWLFMLDYSNNKIPTKEYNHPIFCSNSPLHPLLKERFECTHIVLQLAIYLSIYLPIYLCAIPLPHRSIVVWRSLFAAILFCHWIDYSDSVLVSELRRWLKNNINKAPLEIAFDGCHHPRASHTELIITYTTHYLPTTALANQPIRPTARPPHDQPNERPTSTTENALRCETWILYLTLECNWFISPPACILHNNIPAAASQAV